jgi:hypothetical protein
MRYVVNLYGTVWIRNDNGNKIVVTGDLSHMKGSLGRTIFIREGNPNVPLGTYEDKLTTPLKLVKNSTPVNSQARAAKMAISPEETTSNTSPIPLRDTRTGMRYDIDFRESVWRRTETGKVVRVTADPAAAMGNPRRKLLVVVTIPPRNDCAPRTNLSLWLRHESLTAHESHDWKELLREQSRTAAKR